MKINLQANLGYIYIHECWLMYTIPFMHTYIIHIYINTYIKILHNFFVYIFECSLLHFAVSNVSYFLTVSAMIYSLYCIWLFNGTFHCDNLPHVLSPLWYNELYLFLDNIKLIFLIFLYLFIYFCNWDFNLCVNTKAGLLITTSPL